MKIVVTGGSGRLGQHVIRDLMEHGYEALSLDRVAPQTKLCTSWVADLRRSGDLYEALRGSRGIVHLGAYQAPDLAPDAETFSNNVTATYNVLKAAADLGIENVVLASSIAAYGFIYAYSRRTPEYLPLDEHHPCRPQDPYGLSKLVGEQLADAFVSHSAMTVVSLRLAGVIFDLSYQTFSQRWVDPASKLGGFWCYIDARDAAVACRLALEAKLKRHEVVNIAAPTSAMREPTVELVHRYLPELKEIRGDLKGNWSGMDSSKAERLLGFNAQHVWEKFLTPAT